MANLVVIAWSVAPQPIQNESGRMSSTGLSHKNIGILAIVATAAAVILGYALYAKSIHAEKDAKANEQLIEIYSALRLGMSFDDVRSVWNTSKYTMLSLQDGLRGPNQNGEVLWIFGTPTRWHARNWCLFVIFRNERVSRVLVRTLDSMDMKPENSPPDKSSSENRT